MPWSSVLALAGAMVASLMVPGVSNASHSPGNGPNRDFAVGGGRTFSDIFNIAAHSGPLGEDAHGHMKAKSTRKFGEQTFEFDIEGEVTCLRVVGNLATIGGVITKLEAENIPNPELFKGFLFVVEDNGNRAGLPDQISFQVPLPQPPSSCPLPSAAFSSIPLTQGNIVVHDGSP